uniref:Uncharacterized protein n=1 Tax=Physcomitrium patens TaxID=3218 RepID=A0A2K1IBN2_PHYPA|nr:uncharacterized protein LOC112278072 [Physcomitrium patens]XP_024366875.1 uncharacterized protein LOC112278072 [Physcomitrium patens]XP_024366876.1 uncharacterized protein LOC112278072 [Physcomitrium patens]XP_024366877.1 uncharacterized protein LOC112278072 [Physcomitrium patens]PNR26667.1 hypothetical protein PHYPA_030148 [Physcomitrium patens]|eukprot:XP_024366874.1 uncharacterized protein LOC112278072 [Physcomitrella patens]
MKASVKVRKGQRPLVRAKVPVQVAGLPFYSGISVGDEKELALHVGTNMDAGPSCRLSYRPNDPLSPLAVLLKLGFGLWGSPHAAPFTIAAEFNLVRRENVSFTLHLKPRAGSFSFRKHFLSTSGSIGGDHRSEFRPSVYGERNMDVGVQEEVEVGSAKRSSEAITSRLPGGQAQNDGLVYETDIDCALSHLGLGQVSGLGFREKKCYLSDDPGSPGSTTGSRHPGEGSSELDLSGAQEVGSGVAELFMQRSLGNGDKAAAPDSNEGMAEGVSPRDRLNQPETKGIGLLQSWSSHGRSSWGLTVHSVIPLGRMAVGRVQWGMRGPTRAVDESDGCFYGYKLPVLVLDKISISSVAVHRNLLSSDGAISPDSGPLSHGMRFFANPVDDGSQLGLVTSMCWSIRNQLHSLHSDNRFLKKTIEDMKAELDQFRLGEKKLTVSKPQTRSTQEQDSIRSQLFEELQKKTGSRTSSKDVMKSSGFSSKNRGVPDGQNRESIFDLPIEGLLNDELSGNHVAEVRGSLERSAK